MESLKRYTKKSIASVLTVLILLMQVPFYSIAEEIDNNQTEETPAVQDNLQDSTEADSQENNDEELPKEEVNDSAPLLRGAAQENRNTAYGDGFKIALRWGGTSNQTYSWNATQNEERVIKLSFYYQNEVSPKAYAPGEIVVTIPGIGNLNRSGTKKASDIAADVYGSIEQKRDWSYKYDAKNDIYTFYNNHAIDLGETFNGSFELLYEFNSRASVHEFEKSITATLNDGERLVSSSGLNIEYTSKRDTFYIEKTAEALVSYDGLGRYVPEGKSARDYAWVKYNFRYNVENLNARALKSRYITDTFPEGCVVIGQNNYKVTNPDGTITYMIPETSVPENSVKRQSVIVGYPDNMVGQTVDNTAYLFGTYHEEEMPVLLDESTVGVALEKILPRTAGALISKSISPDYIYTDSINNSISFSASLYANIKTSNEESGVYSVAITDDLMEICSQDKTDSSKNVIKVLDDDEYTFTSVRVPGVSSFNDGNGYPLDQGDYNLKLYALYRRNVTEGDLSSRAISNYTKVYDGNWTNDGVTVNFDEDVLAVRAELSGIIENIPSFYISVRGEIKNIADSIEAEEYVNPKYIINHEFTEYEDQEGHSLINVGDYSRQELYDRDVAIYGKGVARSYDTIVFRERPVDPGYYYAYAKIDPFSMGETGEYFETVLYHYTNMNNKDKSEIKSVEIHGVSVKTDLKPLIDTLVPTYSGLTFKNSLPLDVNMEEYLMDRASITNDGNEIKVVFNFSDNPIVSTNFSLGYKVDARVKYEDYFVDTNPSYTIRTYSYTPDGTMRANSTASHEGKTMATGTDTENILLALASHQQLIKMVKTTYSGDFVDEDAVTPMNDVYTYRLKLRNGYNTLVNTEFIDILEHAELTEVDGEYPYHTSEWYGTFKNIDTTYMEGNGYTVRAYYANTLTPDENSWTLFESHVNGIWTTENSVKAIKVCINEEIPENSIIYVDINMDAPFDTTLEDKKVYNAYTINSDAIDLYSGIQSTYMDNMPSNEVDVRLVEKTYDVYITKTDATNGIKLQGAKFSLYDTNGQKIRTDLSGLLGNIPFKNLKAGTYIIKEEQAPAGYKTIHDYTLVINSDGSYTVDTFEDEDVTEELTFTSTGDYAWTQNVDGTWQSNNYNVNSTTTTMKSNEFTLESEGTVDFDWSVSSESVSYDYLYYTIKNAETGATISGTGTTTKIGGTDRGTVYGNLTYNSIAKTLPAGKYTIEFSYRKDTSTHKGLDRGFVKNVKVNYIHSEEKNYSGTSIVENNIPTIKFNIENPRAKGSITVHKIDEYKNSEKEEQPLANVTFNIKDEDGNVVDTGTTNNSGNITFNNLDWGQVYTIEELEAKQGYELAVQNAYISRLNLDTTVVVENKRKTGTVTLTKQDEVDGTKLEGAKYGLYADDDIYNKDGELEYEKDTFIKEGITNENGQVTFNDLIWGNYYIKELETIYGYELSEEKYQFTVSAENVDNIAELTANEERSKAKLQLVKVDENGNFVQGAEFGLFKSGASTDPISESFNVTMMSDGEYPWAQNEDGTWQSTNNGKASSESTIRSEEFTLDKNGNLIFDWSVSSQSNTTDYAYYTVTNTETGETIGGESTKIGGTTRGTSYSSLQFDPVSVNLNAGKYVIEVTYLKNASTNSGLDRAYIKNVKYVLPKTSKSDSNGQIIFDNIEWGNYYIQEIKAPDGYEIDNTKYEFTVDRSTFLNNSRVVVAVKNETTNETTSVIRNRKKLGKVTLIKYACDAEGNETTDVLPNAVYDLYKSDGEFVGEYTTNAEGKIVVENLDWNSYYFIEKTAPEGFSTSDKKISFVINSKNVAFEQEVTAYDKRESGELTINKKIQADSIYKAHGNSTFIFKIVGKDEHDEDRITLYRAITFSEADVVNQAVDGTVTKTIKIPEMNAFVYEITEEENYRYELSSITPVTTNSSVQNKTGIIDLLNTTETKGEITFSNTKEINSKLTDSEIITNTTQSNFYYIGFAAIPKENEYVINTTLTGNDFTYVLYYSGGQEVEVDTLPGITINGQTSYTQDSTGYFLINVEYTTGGKTYTSEVQTKWVMPGDYFTYTTNSDGTINITGINTKYESPEILYIPSEYNGKKVSQVGKGDGYKLGNIGNVKKVEIAESVTSIGNCAFSGCSKLTSIDLPDTLTRIGDSAFYNCSSLTSIEIPEGVTSIEFRAFYNCRSLTNIEIPEGVTSIGIQAFSGCSKLTSIDLPEGVTSIGNSAFYNCRSLTSIEIPEGVTSIGQQAFYNCSSLTSIEIPEGVTSIGSYAFDNCSSLTSIEIPEGVTSIGSYAFDNCSSLTSIEIPEGVTSIGQSAFNGCSGLTSIEVNDNNNYYCDVDGVLYNKEKSILIKYPEGKEDVTSYIIPEGVTSIGIQAFYGCSKLTSIDLPNTLTSIGTSAFYNCSSLTSIEIPEGVTSIGQLAFDNCSSLTSIEIPEGVTSIGSYAFDGCSSLTSVELSDTLTSIENYAFRGCSSLTSIDLPDTLTSIGSNAFYNCSSLTSIEIPEGVTSIGYRTFYNCRSLTSIELPDTVTSIGDQAFYNCSSLTSIEIPEGVTSIGSNAFYNCRSLTSIEIPEGVTSIGQQAFQYCSSLTSIELPDTVTSIGVMAFSGCSRLTTVYYRGTEEQFNAISISSGNDYLKNATKIYNYDPNNP